MVANWPRTANTAPITARYIHLWLPECPQMQNDHRITLYGIEHCVLVWTLNRYAYDARQSLVLFVFRSIFVVVVVIGVDSIGRIELFPCSFPYQSKVLNFFFHTH